MKKKKYAFAIAMGCVYVALSLGLLISLSGAKYTEKRKVYTEHEAAEFDAAILLGESGSGTQTVTLTDLRPGLEGEQEKKYPFAVANSPDVYTSAAEVSVKYTVRLRTSKALPLDYFLEEVETDADGNVVTTRFQAGEPVAVYADGTPVPEEVLNPPVETEPADPDQPTEAQPLADTPALTQEYRYEYTFYPIPQQENQPVPLSEVQPEEPEQEAEFLLPWAQNDDFVKRDHNLVIQWPSSRLEDIQYIKEVEILELVVTAAGMNHLPVETLPSEPLPTESDADAHTRGVIVLDENQAEYEYWVDLRSFVEGKRDGDEVLDYTFYVDNGVRYGKEPTSRKINYEMEIYIPAVRGTTVNDAGETVETFDMLMYSDSHWKLDEEIIGNIDKHTEVINGTAKTGAYYYLYNEETKEWGTKPYGIASTPPNNGNHYSYLYDFKRFAESVGVVWTPYTPDAKEQPYLKRVVQTDRMKLNNFETDAMLNQILKEDRVSHTISIYGDWNEKIWDVSPYVFDNKILIKVKATFS